MPTDVDVTKIQELPGGKVRVSLATGEIFEGTPQDVLKNMGNAQVNTKRWGQGWKQKAESAPQNANPQPAPTPAAPPVDARDKISRDFYGTEYNRLPPDKQADVSSLHHGLVNDAPTHPYLKAGLTFIQARQLLIATYREELHNRSYPQEIQTALADFRSGLEKDLDEAAKRAGFYPQYSKANQDLKIATAPAHNSRQSMPIVTRR